MYCIIILILRNNILYMVIKICFFLFFFSFAMFYSQPPYSDLILQDATTQLKIIPEEKRWYSDYLGKNFMRAKRLVDCYAGSNQIVAQLILVIFSVFITSFTISS